MFVEEEKTVFKIIQIDEIERKRHLSFIRKTTPDYLLHIKNFNLELTTTNLENIINSDLKEQFQQPLDCCLFLNYGDLYLSTLNALEIPSNLWNYIAFLVSGESEIQSQINSIIEHKIKSTHCLDHMDISTLNTEYRKYESALSFTILISLATLANKSSEWWLQYSLTNLLTSNGSDYGPTSAKQFQENLYKSGMFADISMKIHYPTTADDDSSLIDFEEYSFSTFSDLLAFDIRQLSKSNKDIKLCKNCNRFFVPANRADEKYCDFAFRNFKSCKDVAFSQREKNDDITTAYRKIYKTQNARKQRNDHRPGIHEKFEKWSAFAIQQFLACQRGEITITDMERAISGKEWMEQTKKVVFEK